MEISSFPKAAAAPQSGPHALPNEASAVSSRAAIRHIFDGRCLRKKLLTMGVSVAMTRCGEALGIPLTERLSVRRKMAEAAGKNFCNVFCCSL